MANIFQFIQVNPNQIIADTKAYYESLAGYGLNPADVEMIVINVMAYREQKLLAKMEDVLHQSFVQLASGVALDYWGEIFGVERILNEDDDSYRGRIMAHNNLAPIGTRDAYISKAKSVLNVADCALKSKQEDNSLPPGLIVVCVLQKVFRLYSMAGEVADSLTEGFVEDALNDRKQNIIGDMFTFEPALPIALDGSITVKKVIGSNSATVLNDVTDAVNIYFDEVSLKLKGYFDSNELQRRILAVTNVFAVPIVNFPNVPVLEWNEFYTKGTVNINVI